MNKFIFDLSVCQPSYGSKFHGGGVYGYIVFKKLVEKSPERLIAYYSSSLFLDPSVEKLINLSNVETADKDKVKLEDLYNTKRISFIYSPLLVKWYEPLIKKGLRFKITIHGLRSIEMPYDDTASLYAVSFRDKIKANYYVNRYLVKKSRCLYETVFNSSNVDVITVSEHSKYSIMTHFPNFDASKLVVFYSPSTAVVDFKKFKRLSEKKYYMVISANRWLKNAYCALKAFDELFDYHSDICDKVVVLGLNKASKLYKTLKHKDKFEIKGYQTQDELEMLYSGAYAFLYPSLNEGFGYPPIEAMKYGVPVITTAFSSIPEVCGDAVLYSNPYDYHELEVRILQLEEKNVYQQLQIKGLERFKLIVQKQENDLQRLIDYLLS